MFTPAKKEKNVYIILSESSFARSNNYMIMQYLLLSVIPTLSTRDKNESSKTHLSVACNGPWCLRWTS